MDTLGTLAVVAEVQSQETKLNPRVITPYIMYMIVSGL